MQFKTFFLLAALTATVSAKKGRGGGGRGGGGRDGGGRGGGGRGRGRGGGIDAADFLTSTCSAVDDACTRRGDEAGVWVCRTKTNRDGEESESAKCIDPEKSIATDECGCCGAECPTVCETCPCEYTRRGRTKEGVEIVDEEGEILCVSAKSSGRMTWNNDDVTCNTDCA